MSACRFVDRTQRDTGATSAPIAMHSRLSLGLDFDWATAPKVWQTQWHITSHNQTIKSPEVHMNDHFGLWIPTVDVVVVIIIVFFSSFQFKLIISCDVCSNEEKPKSILLGCASVWLSLSGLCDARSQWESRQIFLEFMLWKCFEMSIGCNSKRKLQTNIPMRPEPLVTCNDKWIRHPLSHHWTVSPIYVDMNYSTSQLVSAGTSFR